MASQEPPPGEAIICVRVPCREGKERVWQAIELLRQEQRPSQQPRVPEPVRQRLLKLPDVLSATVVTFR